MDGMLGGMLDGMLDGMLGGRRETWTDEIGPGLAEKEKPHPAVSRTFVLIALREQLASIIM